MLSSGEGQSVNKINHFVIIVSALNCDTSISHLYWGKGAVEMEDDTRMSWVFIWLPTCLCVLPVSLLKHWFSVSKTWHDEQFIINGFQPGHVGVSTVAFSLHGFGSSNKRNLKVPVSPEVPGVLRNVSRQMSRGPAQKTAGQGEVCENVQTPPPAIHARELSWSPGPDLSTYLCLL